MSDNITKADLVAHAAEQVGVSKTSAEKIVNALIDGIEGAMVKGQSVTLVGFGTFSTGVRQARNGRNPQTKKAMKIPASKVPKFKAGKGLKEAVDK